MKGTEAFRATLPNLSLGLSNLDLISHSHQMGVQLTSIAAEERCYSINTFSRVVIMSFEQGNSESRKLVCVVLVLVVTVTSLSSDPP